MQVAVYNATMYVVGGHTAWREGKEDREKVHDDVWALDLLTWQVTCSTFLPTALPSLCCLMPLCCLPCCSRLWSQVRPEQGVKLDSAYSSRWQDLRDT